MANTLQGQTEDLFPETIVKTGSTEPEYGLSREAETGLVGAITNPFVPVKREVLQPEETTYTQRIDSEPGVYDKKYTPAEYGEPEYDFENAPIVRGTKSALAYAKKLFSSEEAQKQAVDVAKQIPAMGAKLIKDQMQTALGMQQGASALVDKEGNETVYDPSLAVGAVAPAGIVAISQAKAGETVLGIFGGALARTGEKRFDELKDVVKDIDEKQLTFNTPREREEYLFQKSKGVFLGEDKIPRFEIATKDVKLIPYFKKRGALDKTDSEQEQIYAVPEDETMKSEIVLADVVKFDELFKEYPELKKYKVKRLPDEERAKGIRGTFNPRTKTFEIADLNEKEFTAIALHEVQHAVDDLEKRQAGSSPDMFATDAMLLKESAGENLEGNSHNFFYFRTNPETSENFSKYTPEELDVLNNKEHQMLMVHMYSDEFAKDKNFDEFREIYNPIISKFADWEQEDFKDLINLRNEYDELTAKAAKDEPVAFEKYATTSGEVDARNVEARFLNPELQLTVPPKYTADRKKNLDLVTSSGNPVSKSIDESVDTITAAGLTPESTAKWRDANTTSEEFKKRLKGRNPILIELAEALKNKEITASEYREAADAFRPIRTVKDVPIPATTTEVVSALGKKSEKGVLGVNRTIPDGDIITARLDINAYTDYDVWIPTLTHPEKKTMYSPTVVLRDVSFIQPQDSAVGKALNVATGKTKAPFAVMKGSYRSMSDKDAFEYAKQAFNDDAYTQLGYDPTRRGFFYDRKTGEPVLNAEEIVQVGHLVLAKNAIKGNAENFAFAEGGAVMAEDIVTVGQEFTPSKNMAEAQAKLDTGVKDLRADRKVQFDKMTEQLTSGAVKDMELEEQENFVALYKLLKQHHSFAEGGTVPMKKQMEMFEPVTRGFDEGGLFDEGGTIDPVSGNDVPPGSTQEEVRDDIPAQLSEGEFVFPADVVRYFGLETLMKMRQEAKAGLQRMEDMGQMGNSDEAIMSDTLPFDLNDLDMEDDGMLEYADGGVVQAQQGTYVLPQTGVNTNTGVYYTPSQAQPTGYAAPKPVEAASSQYERPVQQDVPVMAGPSTPGYETPKYEDFIKPVEGATPELREYINTKTGEKMMITFINGQPTVAIPEGFVPASEYVAPETTASQTSTVKSAAVQSTMDEPAGREEIEKEEAMYGPGGGRVSIGGNLNPDKPGMVTGATQFGVSFSNMGGLPGVTGMAMTGLSLATGKSIPDSARATITRDGVSVTVTGREYNAMKENNFRGPEADKIMSRWSDEKDFSDKMDTVSKAQRDVKAAQKAAQKAKTLEEKRKAEQDRQEAADKATKAVQDAYFSQPNSDSDSGASEAASSGSFDSGYTNEDTGFTDDSGYTSDTGFGVGAKGGLFQKDKMTFHKQMKRSGLASK